MGIINTNTTVKESGKKKKTNIEKSFQRLGNKQPQRWVIGEERENRTGITFTEIRARDVPKLMTDTKPKVQVQRRPRRTNREGKRKRAH